MLKPYRTVTEDFEISYDLQDLHDVRDRPENENEPKTVIVDSMTAAANPPNMVQNDENAIAAMTAACRRVCS